MKELEIKYLVLLEVTGFMKGEVMTQKEIIEKLYKDFMCLIPKSHIKKALKKRGLIK